LFDLLRAGDILVVRWVDRLGRNYEDVCDTIREFMRRGVVIKTVINGFTFDGATKDPMQKAVRDALIAFMAALGQAQAEATKLAQRAGIERQGRGESVPRPQAQLLAQAVRGGADVARAGARERRRDCGRNGLEPTDGLQDQGRSGERPGGVGRLGSLGERALNPTANRHERRRQAKLFRLGKRALKLRCLCCERAGQPMNDEHFFPVWLIEHTNT
jgi:Resolvase, N terminal domain